MEFLAITALGKNDAQVISELADMVAKHDCNINACRGTCLGQLDGVVMLVSGNWNSVAKLEASLPSLEKELEISIAQLRTKQITNHDDLLPYTVHVISLDQSGVVAEVCSFFTAQEITIADIQVNTYSAMHTNTKMLQLYLQISVPSDLSISDLRDNFLVLCDTLNLDGAMEPEKR